MVGCRHHNYIVAGSSSRLGIMAVIMVDAARITRFRALKGQGKIVCLTAYSAPMAHALNAHCDVLLVGDSVAKVLYGMDTRQGADLGMMIRHGRAVMRRRKNALVIIDLPRGSDETSPRQDLASARRVLDETNADGVKLKGGSDVAGHVALLTYSGIAVLAYIGLMPHPLPQIAVFRQLAPTRRQPAMAKFW